jgi:hypothetical protein
MTGSITPHEKNSDTLTKNITEVLKVWLKNKKVYEEADLDFTSDTVYKVSYFLHIIKNADLDKLWVQLLSSQMIVIEKEKPKALVTAQDVASLEIVKALKQNNSFNEGFKYVLKFIEQIYFLNNSELKKDNNLQCKFPIGYLLDEVMPTTSFNEFEECLEHTSDTFKSIIQSWYIKSQSSKDKSEELPFEITSTLLTTIVYTLEQDIVKSINIKQVSDSPLENKISYYKAWNKLITALGFMRGNINAMELWIDNIAENYIKLEKTKKISQKLKKMIASETKLQKKIKKLSDQNTKEISENRLIISEIPKKGMASYPNFQEAFSQAKLKSAINDLSNLGSIIKNATKYYPTLPQLFLQARIEREINNLPHQIQSLKTLFSNAKPITTDSESGDDSSSTPTT